MQEPVAASTTQVQSEISAITHAASELCAVRAVAVGFDGIAVGPLILFPRTAALLTLTLRIDTYFPAIWRRQSYQRGTKGVSWLAACLLMRLSFSLLPLRLPRR